MSVNYDPDQTPRPDASTFQEAAALGLIPITVLCQEADGSDGLFDGVQFMAFVNFVPRIGERIVLEDGNTCQVTAVYYRTTKPRPNLISMMPNVVAKKLKPSD